MKIRTVKFTAVAAAIIMVLSIFSGCASAAASVRETTGTTEAGIDSPYDPSANAILVNTDSYELTDDEAALVALVENVADTVVEITTSQVTTGSFMQQYISTGAGSGVVITGNGIIITNYHVIDGASSVSVKMRSGDEYPATVFAGDEVSDIAVLKIEATGLKAAKFGDSDKLRVGQTAIAIGNPLGSLGGSVTEGIISATDREIYVEDIPMTLLQTTAAINPGNSGGGLFNLAGDLIGVVNAKSSGSGIEGLGFAIPANTAYKAAIDLLTDGYVTGRQDTGFKTVEITDRYSLAYNGLRNAGVYIQTTSDSSPEDVKVRDLIVSINGTTISSQADYYKLLYSATVGDTLSFNLYRDSTDKLFTVSVPVIQYLPSTYAD